MTDRAREASTSSERLALVIHALHGGGAEKLMSQLAARWADAGHDVHLVTLDTVQSDRYRVPASVKRYGLGLMKVSRSPLHAILATKKRIREMRRVLTGIQPSLILSFCDRTNILCLAATAKLDCPRWVAEHSDPRQQVLPISWRLARSRWYPTATGAVALTPEIADWLRARYRLREVRVIPPAISSSMRTLITPERSVSHPTESSVETRYGGAGGSKRITAVGRLSAEKNFLVLIEAWKQCESRLPNWTLQIAGDGAEMEKLTEAGAELITRGRLNMLGWVDEPRKLLSSSDLFILTSRYEGFPVALLEAMSEGVACISVPCCDAVRSLAARGVLQMTADRTVDAVSGAILELANNEVDRARLKEAAVEVAADFDWDRIGLKWDSLLT